MKEKQSMKIIKTIALVTALSLLGDSMLYIVLPLYWEQAGLDALWQVGVLLSINRFVRLPAAPIVGWLYHRISLRTGLFIATLLGGLSTLGYGLFHGFIAWLILRCLWGIAWSFFRIGGLTSISFYSDENEVGKAMGTYNGLFRLGSLFGMLLGGIFVPVIGLKLTAMIFGILSLLSFPLILYAFERKKAKPADKKVSTKVKIFSLREIRNKQKIVLIYASGFFITFLIQGVLTSTLSSVIDYHYGEIVKVFHFILSAALLSGILQSCRWVWEPFLARRIGIWSDGKIGRIPLFVFFLAATGMLYGMVLYDSSVILWIIITLLVMVGTTAITTLIDSIAIEYLKSSAVTFITLYTVIQDVGAAAGPFIGYMVIELEAGFLYLYLGGAGIFIILAFCWLLLYLKDNKSKLGKLTLKGNIITLCK